MQLNLDDYACLSNKLTVIPGSIAVPWIFHESARLDFYDIVRATDSAEEPYLEPVDVKCENRVSDVFDRRRRLVARKVGSQELSVD